MLNATRECRFQLQVRYHTARPPSDWTIEKLERALVGSRRVVADATDQLQRLFAFGQPHGLELLCDAFLFHFGLDLRINAPPIQQRYRTEVLESLIAIGMGLNAPVLIADALSPTFSNLHRAYQESTQSNKFGEPLPAVIPPVALPGPKRKGDVASSSLGYVSPKTPKGQPALDSSRDRPPEAEKSGKIHLHLAAVEAQSTAANVALLVHEASHKFARTLDAAYAGTPGGRFFYYENFPVDQRIINADCYGYFCVSLFLRELIKGRSDLYRRTNAEPPPAGALAHRGDGAPPPSERCAVM